MGKHIYIPVILMIMSSCTYRFDLRGEGEGEKLYLSCISGLQDTTVFSFYRALGLGGEIDHSMQYLDGAVTDGSITVTRNGEPVQLKTDEKPTDCVPEHCFFFTGEFEPGDRLVMEANVGDQHIRSESVVPAPPAGCGLSSIKYIESNAWVEMEVQIEDNPDSKDYYAVEIMIRTTISDPITGEPSGETLEYRTAFFTGENGQGTAGDSPMDVFCDEYQRNLTVFSDENVSSDGIVRCSGYINHYMPSDRNFRSSAMAVVYSISPETFNWFKTGYLIGHDDLGSIGLRPPVLSYTNISGGMGIFGTAYAVMSGWTELQR